VIVITSGKGGVGKTTTTANIGSSLAAEGKKVVLLDADIGLRNLDLFLGLENRIMYNIVDVVENRIDITKALIKDKRFEGLALLPAAQTKDKTALRPAQMERLCRQLASEYDFVLVDCPAGIEQGFSNAVAGADEAFIVVTPELPSVRDADRVIGLLEAKGIKNPKLIVNRLKVHMVKRGDMMDISDIVDFLGIDLLGVVPDDEKTVVATNRGEPVILDRDSRAGQAYRNISRRILGESVPLMDLQESGLLSRLRRLMGRSAG
jgi:septum site-determining protein MinD